MLTWTDYPNFKKEEFDCKHTGKNEMKQVFMDRLQELRTVIGIPFTVTSGYRDKTHPVEINKKTTGEHSTGMAADIFVPVEHRYELVRLAMELGFTRIGVAKGFIHLGLSKQEDGFPSPRIWTY